jgi:signal transduction histidine kinase
MQSHTNPGRKILVIEDDQDTQANLQDILELDGYEVEAATSVREALAHNNWSEYLAILLDRQLPDGTSDTMLPQIKQRAPNASVIMVTGHTDLDGTITALRYGAMDYLLKPINPDLLRASLRRVNQLREAERRARQAERLAAIGQMITGLAHESGNALARIQACLEMLTLEVEDRPEAMDLINRIQRAQNDLQKLFEEIRSYAAPLKLQREVWDLGSIWRQAWANLGVQHKSRQATLREHTDGLDLHCTIDAFRMEQVFRNIMDNALAACSDPVEMDITCQEVMLAARPALRVALRDNGPGLNPESQQRIFDPFFTTKTKGTGLGMAIARRIVETHGGQIGVGSNDDCGAEIWITLPRENA